MYKDTIEVESEEEEQEGQEVLQDQEENISLKKQKVSSYSIIYTPPYILSTKELEILKENKQLYWCKNLASVNLKI